MLEFNRDNIRAITIHAKQWRDKVSGNSYWSSRVTMTSSNFKTHTIALELQYGYGNQYLTNSIQILRELRYIEDRTQQCLEGIYSNGRRVYWNEFIEVGCTKADVKDWGIDPYWLMTEDQRKHC